MARLGEFFSHGFLMLLRATNIRTTNTEEVQKFNKVKLSVTVCHTCFVSKWSLSTFDFCVRPEIIGTKWKTYSLSRPLHLLLWNLPLLAKDPYAHHTLMAHPDTETQWHYFFRNRQSSELPTLPTFLCQRSWGCLGHLPIRGANAVG